jgi:hypothetical protein
MERISRMKKRCSWFKRGELGKEKGERERIVSD